MQIDPDLLNTDSGTAWSSLLVRVTESGQRRLFCQAFGNGCESLSGIVLEAAGIAQLGDIGIDRQPAQEGDPKLRGHFLSMAPAKEFVPLSIVGADEVTHVFDQSQNGDAQLSGHLGRFAYDHSRQVLRRRHQHDAARRQRLQHRKRSIGRARRQVDDR